MENALIIITGFMGSGKSTVARALARRLNAEMVDLDEEIVKEEGRSPGQILEEDGEPSFREIETRVLCGVLQRDGAAVIALGGGAWTLPRNRDLITAYEGISVWLDAPFHLCWQRILAVGDERPLARNEQEARSLYSERRASYECADLQLAATENKSADAIALEITRALAETEIDRD